MSEYVIEKLDLAEYEKCSNVWNMEKDPHTEIFRREIESGNRVVYVYKIDGALIGEIAYVFEMNDTDYTIPGRRIYLSRLIVKKDIETQELTENSWTMRSNR